MCGVVYLEHPKHKACADLELKADGNFSAICRINVPFPTPEGPPMTNTPIDVAAIRHKTLKTRREKQKTTDHVTNFHTNGSWEANQIAGKYPKLIQNQSEPMDFKVQYCSNFFSGFAL